jgi:hypothetical protein
MYKMRSKCTSHFNRSGKHANYENVKTIAIQSTMEIIDLKKVGTGHGGLLRNNGDDGDLLHGDRLGQVPRAVHVAATQYSQVIGQHLHKEFFEKNKCIVYYIL